MSTVSNALVAYNPADDEPGMRPMSAQTTAPGAPGGGHAESGHAESGHAESGHAEATNSPDLTGRIEKLTQDFAALAAQNRKLLTSVSHLLDLYETEKAQRLALQTSLDRVVEDMASADPVIESQTLAERIRGGVSDDLKPLLHAILDVLEISMRRTPSDLGGLTQLEGPPAEEAPDPDGDTGIGATDDFPRALPEILTRPVEELGAPRQSTMRPEAPAQDRTAWTVASSNGTIVARPTKRRSVLPEQARPGVWIPVTSDKTKR